MKAKYKVGDQKVIVTTDNANCYGGTGPMFPIKLIAYDRDHRIYLKHDHKSDLLEGSLIAAECIKVSQQGYSFWKRISDE